MLQIILGRLVYRMDIASLDKEHMWRVESGEVARTAHIGFPEHVEFETSTAVGISCTFPFLPRTCGIASTYSKLVSV
jgi:hypothetical protein